MFVFFSTIRFAFFFHIEPESSQVQWIFEKKDQLKRSIIDNRTTNNNKITAPGLAANCENTRTVKADF